MLPRFASLASFALLLTLSSAGAASAQTKPAPSKPAQTKPARPAGPVQRRVAPAAPSAVAKQNPASFFGTYAYRTYVVHSAGEQPVPASGVGGTLTLLPSGIFEKRMQLAGPQGPVTFNQRGRFTTTGDKISFAFLDKQQEPKADNGTYRFDPQKRILEITIEGFPAGSKGVYTLVAQGQDGPTR